jgi:hypothetical protein
MKFREVLSRITGISTPVFGVSWNPPTAHVVVAKKVITFLEDRRVLFNPYHMEDPGHCIESVFEMRRFLTEQIGNISGNDGLPLNLRAMRAACRKFLDTVKNNDSKAGRPHWRGMSDQWIFISAIGELRGVFGIHVATIAAQHGLDIEGDLSSILPVKVSNDV